MRRFQWSRLMAQQTRALAPVLYSALHAHPAADPQHLLRRPDARGDARAPRERRAAGGDRGRRGPPGGDVERLALPPLRRPRRTAAGGPGPRADGDRARDGGRLRPGRRRARRRPRAAAAGARGAGDLRAAPRPDARLPRRGPGRAGDRGAQRAQLAPAGDHRHRWLRARFGASRPDAEAAWRILFALGASQALFEDAQVSPGRSAARRSPTRSRERSGRSWRRAREPTSSRRPSRRRGASGCRPRGTRRGRRRRPPSGCPARSRCAGP